MQPQEQQRIESDDSYQGLQNGKMSEFGTGMPSKGNGTCKTPKNQTALRDVFFAVIFIAKNVDIKNETGYTGI